MKDLYFSSAFQVLSTAIARVLGLLIVALLYRLFSLSLIGEYFYILSWFALFVSVQQFGASKILVRSAIDGDYDSVKTIMSLRLYASACLSLTLIFIIYKTSSSISIYESLVLSVCLFLSSLGSDWYLVAKKKFIALNMIQLASQVIVVIFFTTAYILGLKLGIVFHQAIPSIFLFVVVWYFAIKMGLTTRQTFNVNIEGLFQWKDIAYKNRLLFTTTLVLSMLGILDYQIAKFILDNSEIAILGGFLRMAQVVFGLLTALNTVFFSFGKNSKVLVTQHKRHILKVIGGLSLVVFWLGAYPYVTYVMNIDSVNISQISSLAFISLTVPLMSVFFLYLSDIEQFDDKVRFRKLITSLLCTGLIFILLSALFIILLVDYVEGLVLMGGIILLKWILVTISFKVVSNGIRN